MDASYEDDAKFLAIQILPQAWQAVSEGCRKLMPAHELHPVVGLCLYRMVPLSGAVGVCLGPELLDILLVHASPQKCRSEE